MTTNVIDDPELQEQVRLAIEKLNALVPLMGFHPSPMALALLALGTFYTNQSGYVTKEDLLVQVSLFWDSQQQSKLIN